MKKILLMLFGAACLTGNAQYQLQNAGFEEWETVTYNKKNGEEPVNWNSFLDGTGKLKSTAGYNQMSKESDTRPGSTGSYSAKINARKVLTVIAQGNLTTGCVNMGSMTATDANGNYNYTDVNTEGKHQEFTGLPDAMHVWVKFSGSNGKAVTILHTAGYYQDPYSSKNAVASVKKIAEASNTTIASSSDWQELTIPFTYDVTDGTRPAYALVSFATNSTAGKGSASDYMYIDDLEYLYYHSLTDLKYDGATVAGFAENTLSYDLSSVTYDAAKLSYTKKGQGATVETSYDETTAVLTITVKGDNYSADNTSVTTYTLQFAKPEAPKTTYNGGLVVIINGYATDPQSTDIYMTEEEDGTYTLSLNNFSLEGMAVGNIVLSGLTKTKAADGTETITTSQTITIAAGDDPNVGDDEWLGPMLGEVPIEFSAVIDGEKLFCNIDIDMTASLEQYINVAFAPEAAVVGEQSEQPTATGDKNVILARSFSAGWNTICLPFAFTPSEVAGGAVAQAFTAVKDGALSFSAVTSCEANTPYLIYVPADVQFGKIFRGKSVVAADAKSVTYDAFTFTGVYTTEDGMSMEGKYGVATIDGVQKIRKGGASSNIFGTRAYFVSNDANANGTLIRLNDGTTGIQTVDTTTATTGVYNLQGVRVGSSLSTLPAGVYIVNGKKILK